MPGARRAGRAHRACCAPLTRPGTARQWELFNTVDSGAELHLVLSRAQGVEFQHTLVRPVPPGEGTQGGAG